MALISVWPKALDSKRGRHIRHHANNWYIYVHLRCFGFGFRQPVYELFLDCFVV